MGCVVDDTILGPHYLPARLNSAGYLQFLNNEFQGFFGELPDQKRNNALFQHDGAPAHVARNVTTHLNNTFPARWIGNNGPIRWPARSPDMTPLDFYLWGDLKRIVYRNRAANKVEELRQRIDEAFDTLKENRASTKASTLGVVGRAQLCLEYQGDHFEQYV